MNVTNLQINIDTCSNFHAIPFTSIFFHKINFQQRQLFPSKTAMIMAFTVMVMVMAVMIK